MYENLLQLPQTYKKYHAKHTSLLSMVAYDELALVLDMPTCDRRGCKSGLQAHVTPISMGVDSLDTILSNKNTLTHLIYVNKMDLSSSIKHFQDNVTFVANKYNKPLIVANSNFKEITMSLKLNNGNSMPGTNYAVFTNDAIILASCYPLGISKMYFSGHVNIPCIMGQHPEINKYFYSNEFSSVNNNKERIRKINFIINQDEELIQYIRVCNDRNSSRSLNCSKCRKCIITMLYFYLLGYDETCIKKCLIIKRNQ